MLATPSSAQYRWHESERSMFVHFGPATWQGREYDDGSVPINLINPTKLDTDQWCRAAISFGAKRIVFVAKHTGGFCWWQTQTTNYSVGNTPWRNGKGDVLAELSASCKKYNITLGVYIYPGDRNWDAYIGGGGKTRNPDLQQQYNEVFRTQLTQVLTCYGDVEEVWFDGSCVIDVKDILQKFAAQSVIFQGPQANIRWCGTERGMLPQNPWSSTTTDAITTGTATVIQSDADGDFWAPIEVDTTLYDHFWFWSPENEKKRKSLEQLLHTYYQSVGKGAVILLNVSPNTDGLIPQKDIELLAQFGKEIERLYNLPVAQANNTGAETLLSFSSPQIVNQLVLMEEYQYGERVRHYYVEAKTGTQWAKIAQGEHIGRKRITLFEPIKADAIRIVADKFAAHPIFKSIAVYNNSCSYFDGLLKAQNAVALMYDPENDCWISQGMGNAVFEWQADQVQDKFVDFEADLSEYINEPGQYQLSFITEGGGEVIFNQFEAMLEGVTTDGVISCIRKGQFYNITRTSAVEGADGSKTSVYGQLKCKDTPERGCIYIKRLL